MVSQAAFVLFISMVLGSTSALSQAQPWRNFGNNSNQQLLPQPNPEPQGSLVYSPWTRSCPPPKANENEVCATGRTASVGEAFVAGIVLVDPKGKARILRVLTPLGVLLQPGTRLTFDEVNYWSAPYIICFVNGCMADVAATFEMVTQMQTARTLVIQYIRPARPPTSYAIALEGFGQAFDEPPRQSPLDKIEGDLRKNQSNQGR